ncbi:hypothetical protein [Ravibacter arvi]|uniref:hypothetical protein n=1 Tax=Ravibacter arvi TaxID=2051041 RepID=UPI0031ED699A
MVAHLPDGHPEAERSGVEGSPAGTKKPVEMDLVQGAGDSSATLGMTVRSVRPNHRVINGSVAEGSPFVTKNPVRGIGYRDREIPPLRSE